MSDIKLITDAISRALDGIPGAVAMATTGGGTIYEGAFGVRDAAGNVPMTVDTVFGLASMTKAVVSVAALQLVDQEKLSRDAPIAKVLPELADPRVLEGFDADGEPRLRPAGADRTVIRALIKPAGVDFGRRLISEAWRVKQIQPRPPLRNALCPSWPWSCARVRRRRGQTGTPSPHAGA